MKKKHFVLDIISFAFILLNAVVVFCFFLPAGRAYYMPDLLMRLVMILEVYAVFGGIGISGIIGIVLNIVSIFYKKKNELRIKNNIVYLILFAFTIPLAWFMFNAAMSV